VVEHAVDGLKVLLGLIVQVLGLGLELLEAAFGVDVDGILGVLANVELGLELLRRLRQVVRQRSGFSAAAAGAGERRIRAHGVLTRVTLLEKPRKLISAPVGVVSGGGREGRGRWWWWGYSGKIEPGAAKAGARSLCVECPVGGCCSARTNEGILLLLLAVDANSMMQRDRVNVGSEGIRKGGGI
jgi:hypothetical protein